MTSMLTITTTKPMEMSTTEKKMPRTLKAKKQRRKTKRKQRKIERRLRRRRMLPQSLRVRTMTNLDRNHYKRHLPIVRKIQRKNLKRKRSKKQMLIRKQLLLRLLKQLPAMMNTMTTKATTMTKRKCRQKTKSEKKSNRLNRPNKNMMLKMKRQRESQREKNLRKKRNLMSLRRKRKMKHHHRMNLIGSKKSSLPPKHVLVGVRAGQAYRLLKKMAKLIKKSKKKSMWPAITKYRNCSLPRATSNSLRPLMTIHLSIQTAMMSTVRWWKRA